jgi:hypothetical protein
MGDIWLLEGCKKKCPALTRFCTVFFEGFGGFGYRAQVCENGLFARGRYDLWKTRKSLSRTAQKVARERAES